MSLVSYLPVARLLHTHPSSSHRLPRDHACLYPRFDVPLVASAVRSWEDESEKQVLVAHWVWPGTQISMGRQIMPLPGNLETTTPNKQSLGPFPLACPFRPCP